MLDSAASGRRARYFDQRAATLTPIRRCHIFFHTPTKGTAPPSIESAPALPLKKSTPNRSWARSRLQLLPRWAARLACVGSRASCGADTHDAAAAAAFVPSRGLDQSGAAVPCIIVCGQNFRAHLNGSPLSRRCCMSDPPPARPPPPAHARTIMLQLTNPNTTTTEAAAGQPEGSQRPVHTHTHRLPCASSSLAWTGESESGCA